MTIYIQVIFYILIIIFQSYYYTNDRRRLPVKHIYINKLLKETQDVDKAKEIIKYDSEKTKEAECNFFAYLADKYDSEKTKNISNMSEKELNVKYLKYKNKYNQIKLEETKKAREEFRYELNRHVEKANEDFVFSKKGSKKASKKGSKKASKK